MSSFQGYLTYMEYGLGNAKGGAGGYDPAKSRFGEPYAEDPTDPDYLMFGQDEFRTVTQNPFVYAPMTEEREAYTSERVIESLEAGATTFVPAWADKYKMLKHNAFTGVSDLDLNKTITYNAKGEPSEVITKFEGLDIKNGFNHAMPAVADYKFLDAQGRLVGYRKAEADPVTGGIQPVQVPDGAVKVLYIYNNQVIPQEKIPTVRAHMRGISLEAKARRIAIVYSQFAAFQA